MSEVGVMEFVVVSAQQDILDPHTFPHGPWLHLATVARNRPNKLPVEYVAIKRLFDPAIYVEILNPSISNNSWTKEIEDDVEWREIVLFMRDAGLLAIAIGEEVKLGDRLNTYMETRYRDAPLTIEEIMEESVR